MKKTRVLASLLCIVMVVCSMPMMQIFAEGEDVQEPEAVVLDTIAKVIQDGVDKSVASQGDTVAKVKTDDLYATSHDWNFANSTMETYTRSGNGSLSMPDGAEFTSEGLDLSGTNGTDTWKYLPHEQWCFVNALRNGTVSLRAGYVKVKGDVTIAFTGSEQMRLISVVSKANTATTSGLDAKATTFVPDDGWVEYIFVERNSNSVNIYAKKEADTAWVYYGISGSTEPLSDATPNRGLHFSGTGVVAIWKTFDFNENGYNASYPDSVMVATDAETTPATANTLVYGAEFDVTPPNAVIGAGATVANGVLNTEATVANDALGTVNKQGDMRIAELSIPMNGYAEFKAKGNGRMEVIFDDGTNKFYYNRLPADNYSIQGTSVPAFAAFVNDSDMAWRTYRLVRTAEGYSFYSKADGDTGWKIQGIAADTSKIASAGNGAYIYFRFYTNCDGVSVGNGQLDYLRIYGTQADLEEAEGYTIESALGVTTAKNTYSVQVDANTGSREDVAFHPSTSYAEGSYTADGVAMANGEKSTLWGVNPTVNYWSVKNAIVIKAKLGTADDILTIYGTGITSGTRFNYKIAKDQVHHQGGAALSTIGWLNGDNTSSDRERFAPGTDWFELMIVEEANQQKFYGKNAQTGNTWNYLGTVNGYEEQNSTYPVYAIGKSQDASSPTLVKSVMVYREDNGMTDPDFGSEEPGGSGSGGEGGEGQEPGGDEEEDTTIDTIAEVIQQSVATSGATAGDTVAKGKTDDLYATSHDWNFANSTMETYFRSDNGSLAMPEGAEITSEGLDLSGTDSTEVWKYKPHDQWCFVNALRNGTTSFRAGYVKVKGDVTISFTGAEQKRLISVYSKPGTATTSGTDKKATTFTPDSDWVEYLFVPYNSNNVFIWAKKASDTVWTSYGRSGATEALSDAAPNRGLHFSGTGVVAGWKTIDFNENGYSADYPDTKMVATNTEVTPATADTLVYGAEFDAVPTGATLGEGSEVKDGLLSTATTAEAQGDMKITNLAIPVNGYAEFKMKGNGAIEVVFDDGTNMFKLHRLPADNYSIQGTSVPAFAAFVNDSDMAWRTYRLVRTAEGYSFYSKTEGDTGWKIQGIAAEASKRATAGNGAYIYFRFHTNCDGTSAGNGQMDYLRIYGTEADLEDIKPGEGGGDDSGEGGGGGTPGTVTPSGTTIESALNEFPNKTVVTGTITETASTNTWKFANSTMTSYTRSSNVGIVTPEGAKFTDDGLDLSQTNGTDVWKFSAADGWSPMAYANDSYRALYIKMKGNVTADILMADGKSVDKLRSVPGKKLSESNEFASDGTSKSYQFRDGFTADATIDDRWVEYLIVARNTNAALVYVKSDTITEGQWIKAFGLERYYYAANSSDPNYATARQTGISFSGSGVVAEWKTIDFNNSARTVVASDANAKPAGALSLLAAEEFTTEPTYTQKPTFGDAVTISDGVMHAKTRYANAAEGIRSTNGYVKFTDIAIPVGGYAEFRIKSNGGKRIAFDDGVTKWFVNTNNDYSALIGTVTPQGGYVNDSDMSWRTWRIVRGENGYSFYSQAEGDTGWRIHSTDGSVETDGNGAYIQIRMDGNADGSSDGNGQLDYFRIYGPSPDAPISIVDGFDLEVVANNATLKNPGTIRLVVSDSITSGTVIVANYKGKTLKKIQTVEVSELTAENSLLNVKDGINTNVKIFLWDSLEGNSKALGEAISLNYRN